MVPLQMEDTSSIISARQKHEETKYATFSDNWHRFVITRSNSL